MSEIVLNVEQVQKHYGKFSALRGVSLQVRAGELFGLLGPNGAGKTTLLSILSGLTAADSGHVTLFNEPLTPKAQDLRSRIGLATQDLAIYPDLTAQENLRFFGQLYGLSGEKLESRTAALLAAVGLQGRAHHRAGTFSGGMKRRLNLAVAVIHEPQILYLDEPTTGVDPQSRNHIFDLVKQFNRDGLTVIYTSHYMEEVQTLCPRIAILDQGQIQACDTLENLLLKLDAVARLGVIASPELLGQLKQMPGLKHVEQVGPELQLRAADLAPVLPAIIQLCSDHKLAPSSLHLDQPNLERVFLHLTGRALRD